MLFLPLLFSLLIQYILLNIPFLVHAVRKDIQET